jgi:uncharacterized protein YkwD
VPTFPLKPAIVAAVIGLAALAGPSVAGAAICADQDGDPAVIGHARAETATHCLINAARSMQSTFAGNTLPPLSGNPYLYNPAVAHSADMAGMGQVTHAGSDGSTPDHRMAGYASFMFPGKWGWGENVAGGTHMTPYQAVFAGILPYVAGWMSPLDPDPGHRANILSRDFRELGVGVSLGANNWVYYTADFAWGNRK